MCKILDDMDIRGRLSFAGYAGIALLCFFLAAAEYSMNKYKNWKKAEARKEMMKDPQFAPYNPARP